MMKEWGHQIIRIREHIITEIEDLAEKKHEERKATEQISAVLYLFRYRPLTKIDGMLLGYGAGFCGLTNAARRTPYNMESDQVGGTIYDK